MTKTQNQTGTRPLCFGVPVCFPPLWLAGTEGRDYFAGLKARTCATRSLISSSLNLSPKRLHLGLAVVSDAFLDVLRGLGIGKGSLDFGVGQILNLQACVPSSFVPCHPSRGRRRNSCSTTRLASPAAADQHHAPPNRPAMAVIFVRESNFHFHNVLINKYCRHFVKPNFGWLPAHLPVRATPWFAGWFAGCSVSSRPQSKAEPKTPPFQLSFSCTKLIEDTK